MLISRHRREWEEARSTSRRKFAPLSLLLVWVIVMFVAMRNIYGLLFDRKSGSFFSCHEFDVSRFHFGVSFSGFSLILSTQARLNLAVWTGTFAK